MKHPTLQKVSLIAVALVACFALGAQARTRANVDSAAQHKKATKPAMTARAAAHGSHSVSSTYMIDDGTMENGVGFGNGLQNFESIWLNQFNVIPGATQISAVEVAWGTPAFPDPSNNGTPVTIGVWSDPNGDGTPFDAVLLGSVAGTIQNEGTDTFVVYTFSPPVDLPPGATSFFVGDMTPSNSGPEKFYQGIDQNSALHRQSWVAANGDGSPVDINNIGNNDFIGIIDDFGIPGNWGIRADSGNISPTPTPTPTPTPMEGELLWYNGDFDGSNGLANEENTSLGSGQYARVYDDFNVTGDGFDIGAVFSNNLENTNVTAATFEIRQGVSAFNGGTIVASGMTTTPEITPTGRSGFGFTEFTIQISGLSIHLDPGTYWLAVWPTGDLTGRSFVSTTSGANCVGTPCANNDNSFFDSNFFGASFEPAGDFVSPPDFSMGVRAPISGGALQLVSAASSQRGFAIDLPLTGPSGVEDRSGGPNKKYSIQMTFNNPIASVGSASSTCGGVNGISISGNTVTIKLVGVAHACNGSDIMITANNIMDTSGNSLSSATVTMGLLLGDVNADRVVDRADIQAVKADKGQHTDSTNFRSDVSNDGFINASDVMLVRQQQGTSLP